MFIYILYIYFYFLSTLLANVPLLAALATPQSELAVLGAALPKPAPSSKPLEGEEMLTKIKNYIIYMCVRAYIIKGKNYKHKREG